MPVKPDRIKIKGHVSVPTEFSLVFELKLWCGGKVLEITISSCLCQSSQHRVALGHTQQIIVHEISLWQALQLRACLSIKLSYLRVLLGLGEPAKRVLGQ